LGLQWGVNARAAPQELQPGIVPFTPGSQLGEAATQVFARTWGRTFHDSLEFITRQSRYPDFHGLVALVGGEVVGMVFGTRSEPGQWWHDRVAAHVGAENPALHDAWVLTELAVLSPWRGRGIGGRLHDAVLVNQPYPRALLSTEVSNTRARRMYERRDWRYLHPGFAFNPGGEAFVVMAKELRPPNP
jgi:ribosomal protein S18 acetylase RimI-like enzyme